MAPPVYWGTAVLNKSSSWQAAARSATLMPAARITRRCVIVGPPLERVAKRHPEEVRMEVVQPVVQPGRGRLVEQGLPRTAPPVVLPDELVGEVGGESAAQFDRRSRRELVAVALGQERGHRFGWSRPPVVQIPTQERPLAAFLQLGGEPKPTLPSEGPNQLWVE